MIGISFSTGCSHTTSQNLILSIDGSPEPPSWYAEATQPVNRLAQTDSSSPDNQEADPFEEDPFEEDPFEEDPFDQEGSGSAEIVDVADPIEGWNRLIFRVNDTIYTWVFIPVANGYRLVMPAKVRLGIRNFFVNLLGPLRFVNCLLQGKGEAADAELVRFVMNSTVGVLGIGNPAKAFPELQLNKEDFGQTFGRWGIGQGFYIVWPILGPSTARDSIGLVGDYFLTPSTYVEPLEARATALGVEYLNEFSYYARDYESLKEAALDPYEAFRNFYIQFRKKQVAK